MIDCHDCSTCGKYHAAFDGLTDRSDCPEWPRMTDADFDQVQLGICPYWASIEEEESE